MIKNPCVLLIVLFSSTAASAYSSYGLGHLECQTYLDKRAEDQANHDVANTSYIHAYLSGYLTAGNMMHGLVGAAAQDVSINIHSMVQWLDAWCSVHPSTQVAVALESFWIEAANAKDELQRAAPDESKP